jgi:hypothetical protein
MYKASVSTGSVQQIMYKYIVEIASGAMIYIPNFMKFDSGIEKLIRGDTQTHRQVADRISLL